MEIVVGEVYRRDIVVVVHNVLKYCYVQSNVVILIRSTGIIGITKEIVLFMMDLAKIQYGVSV